MINELNSFNQLPVNGQTDAKLNLNILPVKLKCNTSDTTKKQEVKAGDIVVLGDGGDALYPTVLPLENTDTFSADKVYGVVVLARKKNKYVDGEILSIALFGSCVYLTAGDTLTCGQAVSFDLANENLVAKSTSAGFIPLGNILANAVDGQKVRVLLK